MNTVELIVAVIVGFLVREYMPSYLRKKGENLATKEDIEEITKKIESVKATISFEKEREKQFLDTKQSLLMNFYDGVTVFYYEMLAVNFGDFPMDNGKSLFEYQSEFYKSVAELMKSYQRLVIFLPNDSSILKYATEISQSTIEARKVLKNRFGQAKIAFLKEEYAHKNGKKNEIEEAVEVANEENSKFWNDMRPHVEKLKVSYQQFIQEMNNYVQIESKA